jgi:hydrogenase maturation protease
VAVIGVGNEWRGDDGAGLAVVRELRASAAHVEVELIELCEHPAALLDAWRGRDAVIVTDALRSGEPPGTIRRVDAGRDSLPRRPLTRSSTHGIGLQETIELARTLDRLPPRLILYTVEGARFDLGAGLSSAVQAAVPGLVRLVLGELAALRKPT